MPKIKNIIIFVAIALIFFLIYLFFAKPEGEQASLVSSGANATLPNMDGSIPNPSTSNTNSEVAKDFLVIFSNIKNIKLNDAIFSDPAFNSLHDSSIILIPDGTEGRPNPFAPFGNDAAPAPASTTVNNSTSAPTAPASSNSKI
ncbi:MAG: hypothetical protein PHT16_01665 [Candidatus Pacebacteria bacterium]|nr:hypothetical protein [Candidatus Paceibacterota bacterium]